MEEPGGGTDQEVPEDGDPAGGRLDEDVVAPPSASEGGLVRLLPPQVREDMKRPLPPRVREDMKRLLPPRVREDRKRLLPPRVREKSEDTEAPPSASEGGPEEDPGC